MNNNNRYIPELEELYPEIYQELYPFIIDGIGELKKRGEPINRETVNRMVDDILIRCGLWDEDEDAGINNFDNQFEDAEFAMTRPGGMRPNRPNYFRPFRLRRRWHNRNTLRDLLKILAIREILT